jgi:hypothetical protein
MLASATILWASCNLPRFRKYSSSECNCNIKQGCGSGSGLDPDSGTLWIRIRIGNPDPGSGSVLGIRIPDPDPGARKLRNFSGKMHFLVFFFKYYNKKGTYKIALTTFWGKKFNEKERYF